MPLISYNHPGQHIFVTFPTNTVLWVFNMVDSENLTERNVTINKKKY